MSTRLIPSQSPDCSTDLLSESGILEVHLCSSQLKWRNKGLFINQAGAVRLLLPALYSAERTFYCLSRSPVKAVYLDMNMGAELLQQWIQLCSKAKKAIYIQVPSCKQLSPGKSRQHAWWLKRISDRLIASLLIVLFSPLMISLALLVKVSSPGPIFFREWSVGRHGRMFCIVKFRSMVDNASALHSQVMGNSRQGLHKGHDDPRATPLGKWMRKYSLDELPQLFNVVRGELSLVGPRPWAIYDAVQLAKQDRVCLRALPGIIGAWQVLGRSRVVDLDAMRRFDMEYLQSWSLSKDIQILLMTIPKVFFGLGVY